MQEISSKTKKQQDMMGRLQQSQNELLSELRGQKERHRKLVERLQGDITEVEKLKGKRVLMINDGNISLPIYDYLHYHKIFEDLDRSKRMEMLHLLNRFGESIVASSSHRSNKRTTSSTSTATGTTMLVCRARTRTCSA